MEVIVAVAGECQGRQTAFPGVDTQFLVQLADQGGFGGFTRLDLAARLLPQTGHGLAFRALCQQHAPIGIDQGHSRNKNDFH